MSLLGGLALPAGQLAMIANVSAQTASSHLSQLVAGGLLIVRPQGRHRYYRLANADVAHAIEALMLDGRDKRRIAQPSGVPETLAYARTCYSHLAGRLAVDIAGVLEGRKFLVRREPNLYSVTRQGQRWFEDWGIAFGDSQLKKSRFARPCLDWSERRHHIAGQLGSLILDRLRQLKWIAPVRDSRAVRVTLEGQRQLRKLFGMSVD